VEISSEVRKRELENLRIINKQLEEELNSLKARIEQITNTEYIQNLSERNIILRLKIAQLTKTKKNIERSQKSMSNELEVDAIQELIDINSELNTTCKAIKEIEVEINKRETTLKEVISKHNVIKAKYKELCLNTKRSEDQSLIRTKSAYTSLLPTKSRLKSFINVLKSREVNSIAEYREKVNGLTNEIARKEEAIEEKEM